MLGFYEAAKKRDQSQYYKGPKKPFEELTIPAIVHNFIQDLLKAEVEYSKGRTLPPRKTEQVVMFGGFALDQKLGLPSKDYDLYICSPQLVKEMKDYIREYTYEEILSHGSARFPLTLTEDGFHHLSQNDLVGNYFAVVGLYIPRGPKGLDYDSAKTFDVCFGEKEIDLESLAVCTDAPVMSVVASVYPEEGRFSYHTEFNTQAEQRIICTPKAHLKILREKAGRKGMQIMSPDEYAAFQSGVKPSTFDM